MDKIRKIYEGKAKILYETEDPDLLIQYFKDDATAFNAQKRGTIVNKGIFNNRISSQLFRFLEGYGVSTHFVDMLSEREMLVKRLEILPVEVVVRNIIAGSLAKRFGMEEGVELKVSILEFYYKNDALGDPMINEDHIRALEIASSEEIEKVRGVAFRVNDILLKFFDDRGILLVDFKLEFGRHRGLLMVGDEITPDGCRLWDKNTLEKMDKDRFRRDLGRIEETYQEVCRRVCGT